MIEPTPPENGAGLRALIYRIENMPPTQPPKPNLYPTSRLVFEKRGRK